MDKQIYNLCYLPLLDVPCLMVLIILLLQEQVLRLHLAKC
jgi:hypothetical protein